MRKKLRDITVTFEDAFLGLIVLYYCTLLVVVTAVYSVSQSAQFGFFRLFIFIVITGFSCASAVRNYRSKATACSIGLKDAKSARLIFAAQLIMAILALASIVFNRPSTNTWMLILIAVTCTGIREEKLLKACACCGATGVIIVFLLSMLDIIDNQGGDSFGFVLRTHYACFLLCLTLAYCLLKDGKLTWKGELGLIGLFLYNYLFVGGKTAAACQVLLIIGTFLRHYRKLNGVPFQDKERYGKVVPLLFKVIYFPIRLLDAIVSKLKGNKGRKALIWLFTYSFIICAAFFIIASMAYGRMRIFYDLIPGFITVKQRLYYDYIAFTHKPINLLGTVVPQEGYSMTNGGVELYFTFDCGYVKVLFEYGIIPFALMLGLLTWAQKRLVRARRYYSVFLLALFALDSLMEYWMIYLCYNLFILLATCKLETVPAEYPEAEVMTEAERKKLPAKAALGALGVAVFALWCYTAYPISTWSGWTPSENATVVIPGSYMDGAGSKKLMEERMKTAASYLTYYPESECIIASPDADQVAEVLMYWGIDKSRIRMDTKANTAEEMLSNSYRTIKKNGMPSRLTVCTYQMQQERVKRAAAKQHIPVNSICPEMPWHLYLPNYLVEQGRILI